MIPQPAASRLTIPPAVAALAAGFGALVVWAYWPTLLDVGWRWYHDPSYSHGFLIPIFAGVVLWLRRPLLEGVTPEPSAWGLALLGVGIGLRLAGAYIHFHYFDQVSLLPCLAGLVLLAGGWAALNWSWPAVAFLAFMIPLPHTVSMTLAGPMQSLATTVSVFLLQTLGRPALAEGNVILLNDIPLLNVVEACSGLRMLVVFFALTTAVAMLVKRPIWERVAIAASAIPIALVSNILRIAATGLVCEFASRDLGAEFHDIAGLVMPVLGATLVAFELWVLNNLFLDDPRFAPLPGAVTLQRVETNPVSLYGSSSASRRSRRPAAPPAAAPKPAAAPETAVRPS
jgi:exosortase